VFESHGLFEGPYGTSIVVLAVTVPPACSVAVITIVYVPAAVYVRCAVGLVVVLLVESPQLHWYCVTGADTVAVALTVLPEVIAALTVPATALTCIT
jgi:hypothetical protein